jgi:maltose O-acetyltransferase
MTESLLRRVMARPGDAFQYGVALVKGYLYKFYLRARGRRFTAGRQFRVYGRLSIRGPGRVIFGDDVKVWGRVTPWTYDENATIRVGDHTVLAGTRFGCATEITIGRDGIIADCRILDTDFHSTAVNRHDTEAPVRTLPVVVGDNVWVAPDSALMPGTVVGDNCVVSLGSVCSGTFPPNVIVVGNPARIGGRVPGTEAAAPAGAGASSSSLDATPSSTSRPAR